MFAKLPFSPIRTSLYSPQALMAGLDGNDYRSFARRFRMLRVLCAPWQRGSER